MGFNDLLTAQFWIGTLIGGIVGALVGIPITQFFHRRSIRRDYGHLGLLIGEYEGWEMEGNTPKRKRYDIAVNAVYGRRIEFNGVSPLPQNAHFFGDIVFHEEMKDVGTGSYLHSGIADMYGFLEVKTYIENGRASFSIHQRFIDHRGEIKRKMKWVRK